MIPEWFTISLGIFFVAMSVMFVVKILEFCGIRPRPYWWRRNR